MAELNNTSTGQWSETDASNTSASPDGWPSGIYPNQVEPIGRSTMGAIKRFWDRINGTVTSTGSANAYVYTPSNVSYPTSYVTGETYTFKANFANSGAATININGLGAKNIFKKGASGAIALTGSEIQSGDIVSVSYDGTQFQILSSIPTTSTGTVNSGTANQIAYYASSTNAVSGTNAIPNGTTATTQSSGSNDTKVATDAYVDAKTSQHAFLTSGTTWTSPANLISTTVFKITVIGGGGGCSGGSTLAGAGAGGQSYKWVSGLAASTGYTYAIGAAGSGAGGNGGNTTITINATTVTANGGVGTTTSSGGAGGTSTGGDINITGQGGQQSNGSGTPDYAMGGSTPYGGGGSQNSGATGYGSGAGVGGGAGGQGMILIEWVA